MGSTGSMERVRRLRVLLVDDDRTALIPLEAVLSVDYEVVTTTSPRAALELVRDEAAQRNPFDVVCSDLQMREMDGGELLRRIAQLPDSPGCVLITGYVEALTGGHRQADHIFGIVVKPCDPDEIIRLVGRLGRVTRMNRSMRELTAARRS